MRLRYSSASRRIAFSFGGEEFLNPFAEPVDLLFQGTDLLLEPCHGFRVAG